MTVGDNTYVHLMKLTCPGWRGRNERTNLEGIFPRSYVTVIDEKPGQHVSPQPTSYGNLPLEISQSGSTTPSGGRRPSKLEEHGKKFGKKMGNAGMYRVNIRCEWL